MTPFGLESQTARNEQPRKPCGTGRPSTRRGGSPAWRASRSSSTRTRSRCRSTSASLRAVLMTFWGVDVSANFEQLVLGCVEADFCNCLVNTRWRALDEIYKIYMLLHRSDINNLAENRRHFHLTFHNICSFIRTFGQISRFFCAEFDDFFWISRNFIEHFWRKMPTLSTRVTVNGSDQKSQLLVLASEQAPPPTYISTYLEFL